MVATTVIEKYSANFCYSIHEA